MPKAPIFATSALPSTFRRPLHSRSLWNARPVLSGASWGTFQIPDVSAQVPAFGDGPYSLTRFFAGPGTPLVNVYGLDGSGINIQDNEGRIDHIALPIPPEANSAAGSDGHLEIYHPSSNRVLSIFQFTRAGGVCRADSFSWSPYDGHGLGTPGAPFQGVKAAGCLVSAGLITNAEWSDGLPYWNHVLTVFLHYSGLSASTPFRFPATSADTVDTAHPNTGQVSEGDLLMLPPGSLNYTGFSRYTKKLAHTLSVFGARVMDRTSSQPFFFPVENGPVSGDPYMGQAYLSPFFNQVVAEMTAIQHALRQCFATQFVDANGVTFTPNQWLNLLSMRSSGGGYTLLTGPTLGVYDTLQQAVVFPSNSTPTSQSIATGRQILAAAGAVPWAAPVAGQTFQVTGKATLGGRLRITMAGVDTGQLGDGQTFSFAWPATPGTITVFAYSGPAGGGQVGGTLIRTA